jgi:hypothetical protein
MSFPSKIFLPILSCLLAAFSLIGVASAEPKSLMRPTQLNRVKEDLHRAASLADAAKLSADELYKQLLNTPSQDCLLVTSCYYVATEIARPLAEAFANFSKVVRYYTDGYGPGAQVDEGTLTYFRLNYFDSIAHLQHRLHKSYNGPSSGNFDADLACEDVLTTYRVLMNQIVARYMIGIGDTIGLD